MALLALQPLGAKRVVGGTVISQLGRPITEHPAAEPAGPKPVVETMDNHIYFYVDVTTDHVAELVKQLKELDNRLRSEQISRDTDFISAPIWLHIQSPGGGLFEAFSAADQIARLGTQVYSIVEGCCASATTLISLACDRRFITPNSFMLIHQFSGGMWGKYEEQKDHLAFADMAMERLVKFYAKRTGMKKKKVRKLLRRDSWFDAGGCEKMGLVGKLTHG